MLLLLYNKHLSSSIGSVIPYLDTCNHLGNILCTSDKHVMIDNAVKDLNCGLNNLLAEFFYCNSDTLSTLFSSYCMYVYGHEAPIVTLLNHDKMGDIDGQQWQTVKINGGRGRRWHTDTVYGSTADDVIKMGKRKQEIFVFRVYKNATAEQFSDYI